MEYPVWHYLGMNTGLIIAIISVLHVFIAQFAVGGGLFLVIMERWAWKRDCPEILAWLRRHTRFFLLLTTVFGALSGVGIWFAVSTVSPAGTSLLIHNFVFFWAVEWCFFLVEVVAVILYDHSYDAALKGRLSPAAHQGIGWVYAGAGYLSLVFINGIIAFMLTPGEGPVSGNIWSGFFNPTFWPSLLLRSAICLILAGMFGLFTAPRIPLAPARRLAVRASAIWILVPFVLLLSGTFWYVEVLPHNGQTIILQRGVDLRPFLEAYGWILPVIFVGGIAAYTLGERLRRILAVIILSTGLIMVGSFEWIRENARRPWLIPGLMYSNGTKPQDAQLKSGWLRLAEQARNDPDLKEMSIPSAGSLIFAGQCHICHGLGSPRLDLVPRLRGFTPEGLIAQLRGLGKWNDAMPPFVGDENDRQTLAVWLWTASRSAQSAQNSTEKGIRAELAEGSPGFVLTGLPDVFMPLPIRQPFGPQEKYVLSGAGLQGFTQYSGLNTPWDLSCPLPQISMQLIRRGPSSPEVVTDGIRMTWEWKGRKQGHFLQGTMTAAEDSSFHTVLDPAALASVAGSDPYPVLTVRAVRMDTEELLAESRQVLGLSPGFGCTFCHETELSLLEAHDRREKTSLMKIRSQGKTVDCRDCHTEALQNLSLSAAVHGWHAVCLPDQGAKACMTCHISLTAKPGQKDNRKTSTVPLFARDLHHDRGLDCVNCHGSMENHSLALLKAEQSRGESAAGRAGALMNIIKPQGMELAEIRPRLPWVQEPDCTACHDFSRKPDPASAQAFNFWTKGRDELFSRRRDDMGAVRCITCHGAPHALYPSRNPLAPELDNMPPLQLQRLAAPLGTDGGCIACHGQAMPFFAHHPLP